MDLGAISARKGAPNDGTDPFTNWSGNGFYRSKQNSDAAGMLYQWGRKDPFTFVTSSLHNGGSQSFHTGNYPVKIYNPKSELIYQTDDGNDNTGMSPIGGVIYQIPAASSLVEVVKKPNMFYGNWSAVISQVGHSKELWDYYWTSYSRGTDGKNSPQSTTWHNIYLDGYIVLRSKSIYDPCPYGYRTPTNGTYNDFKANQGWTFYSYTGGVIYNNSWFIGFGLKNRSYERVGTWMIYQCSQSANSTIIYRFLIDTGKPAIFNYKDLSQVYGSSLRCIEDATAGAISARKGAPNDGTGKGEVTGYPNAHSRSKQNSDAAGFYYQWGQKDPFTFATSSIHNGVDIDYYGKYPVKVYNDKSELIYQTDKGGSNLGMTPRGGIITQNALANSVMETVKNPNLFCWNKEGAIINHVGHNKELWSYYWTSYSRGTDSKLNNYKQINWHNTYLDGYIVLRTKSIYDPCPYGYRTPTNGTYNDINSNSEWTTYSYIGGGIWIVNNEKSWLNSTGTRYLNILRVGERSQYVSGTVTSFNLVYIICFASWDKFYSRESMKSEGYSVRCIEDDT